MDGPSATRNLSNDLDDARAEELSQQQEIQAMSWKGYKLSKCNKAPAATHPVASPHLVRSPSRPAQEAPLLLPPDRLPAQTHVADRTTMMTTWYASLSACKQADPPASSLTPWLSGCQAEQASRNPSTAVNGPRAEQASRHGGDGASGEQPTRHVSPRLDGP